MKVKHFFNLTIEFEVYGSDLKLMVKEGNKKVTTVLDGLELTSMFGNNKLLLNKHIDELLSFNLSKLIKSKNIDWSI